MNLLTESKKLRASNKSYILENLKLAKQYADQGKLSKEDLEKLVAADPTPQKKFVGWMSKIWMTEKPDLDDLRNTVEEFNTFLNKGKAKTKDINQFKSFKDLHSEVDAINKSGEGVSVKDLENDYETVIDNSDLLIMSPHTHEASRKLGLSKFAFRKCEEGKDSAWCTTYKAPDHFNDYYYTHNVTFYYIRIKSPELIEKLKQVFPKNYIQLEVVALAVLEDGKIDGYDGLDKQMSKPDIRKYTELIGIS
jgi:hypothetical protein